MSKSKIYKELLKQDIEKIIVDLYGSGSKLLSSRILKGGLFNTTYLLHTNQENSGLVLRVGPVNKHLLFDFEKNMMSAEPIFHKLLHDNDIPTSNVLKYSPKDSVIERDYIVIEYINSIPMNDESLKDVDLNYLYEEVGRLANRMHKITNNKFGWLRLEDWGLHEKWSDFITAFASEAANKAEEYKLFSKEEINKFGAIISASTQVLDEISVPYMTHTDLWQGNILLSQDNEIYKVAAIIDLDRTIFGDKYWDFSTPWIINDSFIKGYNENIEKTVAFEARQDLYKLLGGFFGSYVCMIEYDDFEWYNREKEKTVSLLSTYRNRDL